MFPNLLEPWHIFYISKITQHTTSDHFSRRSRHRGIDSVCPQDTFFPFSWPILILKSSSGWEFSQLFTSWPMWWGTWSIVGQWLLKDNSYCGLNIWDSPTFVLDWKSFSDTRWNKEVRSLCFSKLLNGLDDWDLDKALKKLYWDLKIIIRGTKRITDITINCKQQFIVKKLSGDLNGFMNFAVPL